MGDTMKAGPISFLTCNVEGLSNVYEPCVRDLLSNYDFVLLTETFSVDFPSHLFPMHDVLISPWV